MEQKQKQQIKEALAAYMAKYPSRNKAAQSLKGVSAPTISSIMNDNWVNISDDMWRNIAAQVCTGVSGEWQIVATSAHQEMNYVLDDAQRWRNVTWVVGDAGCGKTTAARQYEAEHGEVFYILCSEDMRRGDFIRDIASRIGLRTDGYTLRDSLDAIIAALVQMQHPLLIFDEADKLSERVFHYFIDLYNRLEERCGIVFFSTAYIKRRIKMGLRYDKKGYNEIDSRIGRKFFELEPTGPNDVYAVCAANGLSDKATISGIIREVEECDFDLRRVKKAIHKAKRISE
ncbi:ATP-binding protein [Hoylesella saccharolytica]|uniref:ATP-binding protein n=1 Tax=Hoylesella saccharolytica TaxID=633701 RepID=UPI0028E586B4|nr:ATP-binding protein [Hoylesella saccharolytica]